MAATEVIRFPFGTQAVLGVPSSTLNPSFLFEHSPPITPFAQPFSPFGPPSYADGIRVPGHLANCLPLPLLSREKGRLQCKRPICTKRFSR
jgi:hypothetical protein